MDHTFWQKQTKEQPLFPDMLWSQPENRLHAGKLFIAGGNGYEFKAPANAYGDALNAGAGTSKVLLPDSMKKVVSDIFPEAGFAPSTPSGSFARRALGDMLEGASWADGTLLAGDFGRNSETAIMLEAFAEKYHGQLTITKDALNYFLASPQALLNRPHTTIVASFGQLQKLAVGAHAPRAFVSHLDLLRMVNLLHDFANAYVCNIIIKHQATILVASEGKISSTLLPEDKKIWCLETAVTASVWWLQNPGAAYQALTTSVIA
jgi:NAD(P)H-hydrate repair Nnr-like enzyme with NAD(P)H-hydrate dehydratase domain